MTGRLRLACVLVVAVVSATGCDRLPGKPGEAEREVRPTEVRDFSVLYGLNCAGCHGADGTLGGARPLNDPLYQSLVDDETLERIVGEGIAGSLHPAFARSSGGRLTDEQVRLLVDGMRQRWGGPAPAGVPPPPYRADDNDVASGDPALGAEVWSVRCAACHGDDGTGGPEGGSVVDPDYLALVTDQALRTAVICGRPDLGMPDWRGRDDQTPLRAEDVSDVVAWLAAHRKQRAK